MTNFHTPDESSAAEKRMRPFDIIFDNKRDGYLVQGSGFDFFLHFTGSDGDLKLEGDAGIMESAPHVHHVSLPLWNGKHSVQIVESLVHRELVKFYPEQF